MYDEHTWLFNLCDLYSTFRKIADWSQHYMHRSPTSCSARNALGRFFVMQLRVLKRSLDNVLQYYSSSFSLTSAILSRHLYLIKTCATYRIEWPSVYHRPCFTRVVIGSITSSPANRQRNYVRWWANFCQYGYYSGWKF